MAPLGMPGIICTRVKRRRISKANSSFGAGPAPGGLSASDMSAACGFSLDDQLRRPLARDALATARETRQDRAIPQADEAFAEQPFASDFHDLIIVVTGEADGVRRLTAALSHESEGAHVAMLRIAGDLGLRD